MSSRFWIPGTTLIFDRRICLLANHSGREYHADHARDFRGLSHRSAGDGQGWSREHVGCCYRSGMSDYVFPLCKPGTNLALLAPCTFRDQDKARITTESWPHGALEASTLDEVHFLPFFTRMKNNIFTLCQEYCVCQRKKFRVNPNNHDICSETVQEVQGVRTEQTTCQINGLKNCIAQLHKNWAHLLPVYEQSFQGSQA